MTQGKDTTKKNKELSVSKVISKIFDAFFTVVLIGVIAIFVMYLMGIKPYITMSGSMEPVIHTGSVCFVNTKAEFKDMRIGDIIAYETPTGGLVTHRIIGMEATGFETKGDNNDVSDGVSTTPVNFHGKTLFSIPLLGYLMNYIRKPVVIAVIVILYVAYFVINKIDDKEEEKKAAQEAEEKGSAEASCEQPPTVDVSDMPKAQE